MPKIQEYSENDRYAIQKALKAAKDELKFEMEEFAELMLVKVETIKNWMREKGSSPPKTALFRLSLLSAKAHQIIKDNKLLGDINKIYEEIDFINQLKENSVSVSKVSGVYSLDQVVSIYKHLNPNKSRVLAFGLQNLIEGKVTRFYDNMYQLGDSIKNLKDNYIYIVPDPEDFPQSDDFSDMFRQQVEKIFEIPNYARPQKDEKNETGISNIVCVKRNIDSTNEKFVSLNVFEVNLSKFIKYFFHNNEGSRVNEVYEKKYLNARSLIYSILLQERSLVYIYDHEFEKTYLLEPILKELNKGICVELEIQMMESVKAIFEKLLTEIEKMLKSKY